MNVTFSKDTGTSEAPDSTVAQTYANMKADRDADWSNGNKSLNSSITFEEIR